LVSPKRYTYDLLVQAGAYAVNFLPLERADLIARLGRQSGRDLDKFAAFGIEVLEDEETLAPVLKKAYAAYECRVVDRHTYGDHDLFVGEIVRIHRREGAFTAELCWTSSGCAPPFMWAPTCMWRQTPVRWCGTKAGEGGQLFLHHGDAGCLFGIKIEPPVWQSTFSGDGGS